MTSLRDDLRETLPFCAAFAAIFGICYSATAWWTGKYASLPAWDLPFEHRLPFVPALSLVYLTITPVLMLAPLILRKRAQLAPFAVVLCVETLVACAFFLLFPQTTAFVRPEVTGWARLPFHLADTLNLSYNQFPSLHVAFACSAAWAYSTRSTAPVWAAWSAAVALSTWLMWEHHLLDIAGGIALAVVSMNALYPRLQRPGAELLGLWQCARFSRRHLRYFAIFLAIYLPSVVHWRRYRAVRYGFCTAQWVDDLLDGHRRSLREPLEIVDELLAEMSSTTFSDRPLSRLTAALFAELDDVARRDFIDLARCMRRDRVRVLGGEVWTEGELDAHHRTTFSLSVNLMLATAGCTARAQEVPSLVDALAWCSVFRDLSDDLEHGLINIPRGVDVQEWSRVTRQTALVTLQHSAREIEQLGDRRARKILGIFQRSIEKFAKRRGERRADASQMTARGSHPDAEAPTAPPCAAE